MAQPVELNSLSAPSNHQAYVGRLLRRNVDQLRISVPTNKGTRYLDLRMIASIQAAAPYSYLHLTNGEQLFNNQSIRYYARKLEMLGFVRVHKSWVVNARNVELYDNEGNGRVVLNNEQEISFARGKKRMFMQVMEKNCL